jgi:SH3-like domain-containing protein
MSKQLNVKQVEKIVMLSLIIIFLFWMARQCARSGNQDTMQPIVTEQTTPATTATEGNTVTATATQPVKRDTVIQKEYINRPMPLFVWVNGLKVRSEPYLTSSVVAELPLNAQVNYEGEVSPFKQKITLENVEYDERWLKIKTADGKQGWIYGGGIRLYQK